MSQLSKHRVQTVFISVTVLLASLSATFVIMYVFMPRYQAIVPAKSENPGVHVAPAIIISSPVQLKIDTIKVDAVIKPVGLTTQGDMDIDEDPEQLAWYKLGPKPGNEGSAVIAGHYGWKNNIPSVFNDLHTLTKGDEIITVDEDGLETMFVVSRLASYAPEQDATDVFKSDDGKAHLNLITCQGSWNNALSTYTERLVVFTDLVER